MNTSTLLIESVIPLTQTQLGEVRAMVKSKTDLTVENRITPDLMGGMRIHFNGKVLDFSLKARIIDLRSKLA